MRKLIMGAALMMGASNAMAASEAACAIWICLPAGFAFGECSAAKKEFKDRIFKGKKPLPAFSSCSADGESHGMDVIFSTAILWSEPPEGVGLLSLGKCRVNTDGENRPRGCKATLTTMTPAQNGVPLGETLVNNPYGPEYMYDPLTESFRIVTQEEVQELGLPK